MKRGFRACCAAFLAISALPAAAAAEPADGSSVEFVALTYNVAGLPEGLSGSNPSVNSSRISPLLDDYDLVLLQEDWADPIDFGEPYLFRHDDIVGAAHHPYRTTPAPAPLGLDLTRLDSGEPPLIADGLNRLSDFPFTAPDRRTWNSCSGGLVLSALEIVVDALGLGTLGRQLGIYGGAADCMAQKGFSMARTTFGDGLVVDVYNLHGEAGGGPADDAARARDYVQLAAYIEHHSAGNAVIVAGDTNLHTAGPEMNPDDRDTWETFQARTGVIDVCASVDCGDDAGVIDKFAVRDGDRVSVTALSHRFERDVFVRADGEPLSDHDPLAVRFVVAAR